MQYIAQAFVGSFLTPQDITHKDILAKLTNTFKSITIEKLIVGWHIDKELYTKIILLAHSYGTEVFLWLPIFSEIDEIIQGISAIDYDNNKHKSICVIPNEEFSFSCPSHLQNQTRIYELYQKYYSDIAFDGIFMDKIRYSTFANGFESALGCFCPSCKEIYSLNGIDIEECIEIIKHQPTLLHPCSTNGLHLKFSNNLINKLFKVRANIVSSSVINLIEYFKQYQLKIGLDVFSPFFAYYVGQDISELSQYADFIKPMIYQITNAPAGIPFEEEWWTKEFKKHTGFDYSLCELWNIGNLTSIEAFALQTNLLKEYTKCPIYSGIEINYKNNICQPNHQYIIERLKHIDVNKQDGVVLSWDILSDTYIDVVCLYNKGEV